MNQSCQGALLSGLIAALGAPASAFAADEPNGHKLEIVARAIAFDVEYQSSSAGNPRTAYDQSALGLQLNYESPYLADMVGVGASVYSVNKIDAKGPNENTTQLLRVGSNGRLEDSYQTIGQAFLALKFAKVAGLKAGRQRHDSLLLKSTTSRAVPDTFSGVSGEVKPTEGTKIYLAAYDRWRPRTSDDFSKLKTDLSRSATVRSIAGDIDYVGILGGSYKNGAFASTLEYLVSHNYLEKFGLTGAYTIPLENSNRLKLSSGLFTSRDAGGLFVCGAESEVDCASTAASEKGKPIHNDGKGIYLDADWKTGNFTLGGAVAKFDGVWIEDNFSADSASPNANGSAAYITDHGTNPFPTSAAMGPDLTNNQETVWSVRVRYDWAVLVPGLSTAVKYSEGSGAKNSYNEALGSGSEKYRELDVKYVFPFAKGLSFRYLYMDYDSQLSGTIGGITRKGENNQRMYLDYAYKF